MASARGIMTHNTRYGLLMALTLIAGYRSTFPPLAGSISIPPLAFRSMAHLLHGPIRLQGNPGPQPARIRRLLPGTRRLARSISRPPARPVPAQELARQVHK